MSRKMDQWVKDFKKSHNLVPAIKKPDTLSGRFRVWRNRMLPQYLKRIFRFLTDAVAIVFILNSNKIQAEYSMGFLKKFRLGFRMRLNVDRIATGSSFRAHLLMARKILEMPSSIPGVVVECGSFKGGSAANLSLVCKLTGRTLVIYDSFAGLPNTGEVDADAHFHPESAGILVGSLEEVQDNIRRYGCIDVCRFVKGWFNETLPQHNEAIAAMFLDVDYQSSLSDCIINLWPHLHDKGYVFIDEFVFPDYCAIFYSEKFWRKYFDRNPPGLIGAGSGVPLGEFYFGPEGEKSAIESRSSIAYTRKNLESVWLYYPDEPAVKQKKVFAN